MAGYKLASVQTAQGPRAAAVIGDLIYDAAALTGNASHATVQSVLDDWDNAHRALDAASKSPKGQGQPVAHAKVLAPLGLPGVIYCAGANYQDHAEEMAKITGQPMQPDPHTLGLKPWFFIKSSRTVTDPGGTVRASHYSKKLDWEVELVVVVGRKAKDLTIENALSCVAGYTCGNDLSARDFAFREQVPASAPFRFDWVQHKSFEGATPLGPWITPAAYVKDPTNLAMKLWVNDSLRQNSNSGKMIFTAAEQIAHLSTFITLHPGDIIMTGTPAGVGFGQGLWLKAGDVVKIEIAEIGTITNTMA